METLIVGASGKTGQLVTHLLLQQGQRVKVIVRAPEKLPESIRKHENITIITATLLSLTKEDLVGHVAGCAAVISCLGHNLTWKGIYGAPRWLVSEAVRLLCEAINDSLVEQPVKFVLMNTTGNKNEDLQEHRNIWEQLVIGLIRLLLPPHRDNEQAANFLRTKIDKNARLIEWVVVRPDTLIDEDQLSAYSLYLSPIRSPLFNPGKTSRINVAHFMAELATDAELWDTWTGQMPVIYNKEES